MQHAGALISRKLTGLPAQALTAALTEFHRPPGSAGYHAATNLVADRLRSLGLSDVASTTYPLDGTTVAGHGPLPLAWEPYGATVRVIGPVQEPVVDMETTSSCLAWWSTPTPPGGLIAELVDVGTGERDEDFDGKDLASKLVLIGHTERPGGWMYAARRAMQQGARGILSDYLFYLFEPYRTRQSLPEAVQLLRLPNQSGEFDTFACSISYSAAERLRALLRLGSVTLHADIQCRLFKGEGQNLLATIPGAERPDESVYFIAHCSAATKPCANCAAGPSLMVEIAGVLNGSVERGELRRPRRSIKFLFLIEGLGSRVHIDANRDELAKVKTAFCFDSVGHDQGKLKSSLLFYRHPDSSPSFVNHYFAGLMERAPQGGSWVFWDSDDLSPVQFAQAPYTPWSDNHYWAAYGVPSPLIMSWPDRYFHTQLLTADNTDPRVFRRVGVTTALAAYEIADAGLPEALAIADEVVARARARLDHLGSTAVHAILESRHRPDAEAAARQVAQRVLRELAYVAARDGQAAASALTLIPDDERGAASQPLAAHADALRRHADLARERVEQALDLAGATTAPEAAR